MKNTIFLIVFLLSNAIFACTCEPLAPISEDLTEDYNVVFYGKVDSVSVSDSISNAHVYFTVRELYKGYVQQQVSIEFDDETSCMMSFAKDEEWLVYANFQRFDDLVATICGHSRKSFKETTQDYYQITAHRTFEEERQFLTSTLSIQPFDVPPEIINQQHDFKPRNILPTGINKLWLLSCSFLIMVIVYFITRKKNKKND